MAGQLFKLRGSFISKREFKASVHPSNKYRLEGFVLLIKSCQLVKIINFTMGGQAGKYCICTHAYTCTLTVVHALYRSWPGRAI